MEKIFPRKKLQHKKQTAEDQIIIQISFFPFFFLIYGVREYVFRCEKELLNYKIQTVNIRPTFYKLNTY